MTLSAGREKSTSMPSPSRLKSFSTFNRRNARPSTALQCMFTCMRGTGTIRHEVHRPRHVRRARHRQCIGLVPFQAFARLNAQIQLRFAVEVRSRCASRQIALQSPASQWDKRVCGSTDGPAHCADAGNITQIPGSSGRSSAQPADRRSFRSRRSRAGCNNSRSHSRQRCSRPAQC